MVVNHCNTLLLGTIWVQYIFKTNDDKVMNLLNGCACDRTNYTHSQTHTLHFMRKENFALWTVQKQKGFKQNDPMNYYATCKLF